MKFAFKGYVYESVEGMQSKIDAFLRGEYQPKSMDELLQMHKYNEEKAKLEKESKVEDPDDFFDFEEELEKNQSADVPSLLSKWNINAKEVDGDYVYEERGDYFIVRGREVVEVNKLIERPENYSTFPEFSGLADRLNAEFWKFPETLYHATECSNMPLILKEGMKTSVGTGLSNRNSRGVFTSTEPQGYIDSYGECKVVIDAPKMKADGFMPFMEREPEVFEYMLSGAISHKYDIDVTREVSDSGGMDPHTWIVGDSIPPKYLSQLET